MRAVAHHEHTLSVGRGGWRARTDLGEVDVRARLTQHTDGNGVQPQRLFPQRHRLWQLGEVLSRVVPGGAGGGRSRDREDI
jgi:hypothetical protein